MKYIKPKAYVLVFVSMLSVVFSVQPTWAEQANASFDTEFLVSDSRLSSQRGQGIKDSIILSSAQLDNNVITVNPGGSVSNGNNVVGDQAFANVNGIPTVVQNSGNNVIIQNSTIVNMTFQ